jgi:transcriptional regulator with GAF, ATPase, and Fis domain
MQEFSRESTLDMGAPLTEEAASELTGRLVTLYEISKLLLEQCDSEQVVATIHRALVEHLAPDHACVLALLKDGSYRPVISHNLDLSSTADKWKISHTALQRAQKDGLALLATDVLRDPQFEGSGSIQKLHIRSVMCVPLGNNPVRGLIYMDRRSRSPAFARGDLQFLTALSAYASLVLEHFEQYRRTSEALKLSDERLELLQTELLRHRIIGESPKLLAAYDQLRRLARSGARVLIRGETGTGKELFARAYAAHARRPGKAYVPVAIPALAPNLIESELFGHVKGAFTEASRDKKGYLEVAGGGVLFLDEIGDIDPSLQVKLLRFLDSGELYRVGDTEPRTIDTLVVSATNRNLEKLVEQERFRADLLARMGHVICIPPLRERPEDIPLLVEHFAGVYGRDERRKRFDPETLDILQRYRWEFNVRQLQQVVEHVVCLVDKDTIRPEDLPEFLHTKETTHRIVPAATPQSPTTAPPALREVLQEAERDHYLRVLEYTKGSRRKAIEMLGVSSDTFYRRLEEFGLHKRRGR